MNKRLLKLVVGSLTTFTLFISMCFVVNATNLDDYSPTNGSPTLPLKTWDDIIEPNDLLGVTLLFSDNPKSVGLPYNAHEGGYLEINYSYNSAEYELESFPLIWGLNSSQILTSYEINSSMILRIEEEFGQADDPISIFSDTYDFQGLLLQTGGDYDDSQTGVTYYDKWLYGPRLISFPYDQRDNDSVQLELVVTGNDWSSDYDTAWQAMYAFLRRNTTIIYSSNMASDLLSLDQVHAYNEGYNVGYKDGYHDGELNSSNDGYRFTFLTGIFNAVSDLLSIEIFPNVQLGYFVFIPLALGITGMIFWFWRKD